SDPRPEPEKPTTLGRLRRASQPFERRERYPQFPFGHQSQLTAAQIDEADALELRPQLGEVAGERQAQALRAERAGEGGGQAAAEKLAERPDVEHLFERAVGGHPQDVGVEDDSLRTDARHQLETRRAVLTEQ